MNITIVYIPEQPRDQVAIHAWDQDGMVWSQKGERALDGRLFRFLLAGQATDQREVSFKYHFLTEDDRWESDEYVRTIPTSTATSLWTFDYTARCLVQDPGPTAAFPTVTIHVITQRRYRAKTANLSVLVKQSASLTTCPTTPKSSAAYSRKNALHMSASLTLISPSF
jgi:hypothetical protein